MKKAVVFYTYLPPWRIDVFNQMGKLFDLKIVFLNTTSEGFTYNRNRLSEMLKVPHQFWNKGFQIKGKVFRTGIIKYLRNEKPEVVFSHEYSPTSLLLAIVKKTRLLNYSIVITTSDNLKMAQEVGRFKKIARKIVLSNSKGVIVYSEQVKKFYKKEFPHLNVEICPNIQDPNTLLSYKKEFKSLTSGLKNKYHLNDTNIVLFIGRLVDVKGLDLLINSFNKCNNNNYKLVIVGEGKERENLENMIKEYSLKDKIIMPGFFDGAELYAWYEIANFFVLPSRYEPFGAVVNEALVLGCPVMASKYIGALEFIDEGVNGYVFDPLIENEFVSTLNNLMLKYENKSIQRENLMHQSFEAYTDSFINVLYD